MNKCFGETFMQDHIEFSEATKKNCLKLAHHN